jgi:hypothetical protein
MTTDQIVALIFAALVILVFYVLVWRHEWCEWAGVLDPSAPVPDNRPPASEPLQPWTPAEREAFGINDTERFIRETDLALASPLERTMMVDNAAIIRAHSVPEAFIQTGSIDGSRIWVQQ